MAIDRLSLADAAEMLWTVVANVNGGDWTKQTPEWREAAARWRDAYFASLKALSPPPPPDHIVDIAVMLENTFADPVSPPPPEPLMMTPQELLIRQQRQAFIKGYCAGRLDNDEETVEQQRQRRADAEQEWALHHAPPPEPMGAPAQKSSSQSSSSSLRARIIQAGTAAWPDIYMGWDSAMGAVSLAAAREALLIARERLDNTDYTCDRSMIDALLADLGGS